MNSIESKSVYDDSFSKLLAAREGAVGWWLGAFRRHRLALLAPLSLCFLLSVGYALWGPKQWRASQVFHLRDEIIGRSNRPGVFASLDEMKVAQETVLEIARHPEVVRRTLEQLGPSSRSSRGAWPSSKVVEETQGAIQVSAANGAELGKTDLIRLTVVADSPERARKFAEILRAETEVELRRVRYDRACSMQAELGRAVESAQASLAEISGTIEKFELEVGPDLAELRNLIEPKTGDILLYRNLGQIQTELRAVQSQVDSAETQRALLAKAVQAANPDVLATPNNMLDLLPAVRRLKEGWVDAQLNLATVSGDYSHPHPKILAAEQAVAEVEEALRRELRQALSSLDDQITILQSNALRLTKLVDDTTARLQRLTEQRVIYDQLNEEYKRRDEVLRELQSEWVRTTSMTDAAQSADLLTRVADVQVASQPEGPSKRTLVGGSTLLGLLVGIGLVMFLTGPAPQIEPTRSTRAESAPRNSEPSLGAPSPSLQPAAADPRRVLQGLEQSTFVVEVVPPASEFPSNVFPSQSASL